MNSQNGQLKPSQSLKLLIIRDRKSAGGGIHHYYESISRYLNTETHFVDVGRPYTFYGHQDGAKLRFTIFRLLLDWFAMLMKVLCLRPKVVVVNPCLDPPTFRSLRRDAVNILIGRLFRRPVVAFWRGWENAYIGQPEFPAGNTSLLCRIYKCASAHIVLSERFKEDLIRWGFETPVFVETTVVADDCLKAAPDEKALTRTPTNLLYLSRVEIAKGVFELLEAYQLLKKKNASYTLTIAGDGPDLAALKHRAAEMGLKDVVFTGYVTGHAKADCYRCGGTFCFLSYTEGMPNAVLEALAMGLPVVSSDAGGLRDILRDGENGFIVSPTRTPAPKKMFDPQVVANAIERLVETPELYQRIAIINWRYARQRFAPPVVAKRLEAVCHGLFADALFRPGSQSDPASPVLYTTGEKAGPLK